MLQKIKGMFGGSTALVNQMFDRVVKETGTALDSETAAQIKEATKSAIATARKVSLYLTDLNGDGKFDAEDVKLAAEKAGVAWDKIDPDLKSALVAGGAAGIGVNFRSSVRRWLSQPSLPRPPTATWSARSAASAESSARAPGHHTRTAPTSAPPSPSSAAFP